MAWIFIASSGFHVMQSIIVGVFIEKDQSSLWEKEKGLAIKMMFLYQKGKETDQVGFDISIHCPHCLCSLFFVTPIFHYDCCLLFLLISSSFFSCICINAFYNWHNTPAFEPNEPFFFFSGFLNISDWWLHLSTFIFF